MKIRPGKREGSILWAARRSFLVMQATRAAIGLALSLAFLALAGPPDLTESVAMGLLVSPLLFGMLALCALPLASLEWASLAGFAVLIGYLSAITGGLASPLIVWLALVPAEAALAGERSTLMRAGAAAGAVLVVVAIFQLSGALPLSRLAHPGPWLTAASMLAVIVQTAFIARAIQKRQSAADAAASRGAAMYRFLADNAMDLITRHGPDGRITFASPAARSLLDRAPESLLGAAPVTLVHPDDLRVMQSAFVEASYFGRPAAAEVRMRRADGSYVWVEIRCRPAQAERGQGTDIVAVTRDITERKAHEEALVDARDLAEEASRAKSRFLANMSHELRTPLNAIIGFSEVMSHQMFGPIGNAKYHEYSGLIHESGTHLLELINGILDMSKIEAGKFELAEEMFPLDEVLQSAMQFVKVAADRAGVAVAGKAEAGARTIFADKRAVKQILINLLSNGVKFTPRGGYVDVLARRGADGIEIAVADTGLGIAAADLAKLGKPFEQVEGEHVRTKEGTGLGLALVKALARMHGGEAHIASELGVGTIVRVLLPHAAVETMREAQAQDIIPLRGAA